MEDKPRVLIVGNVERIHISRLEEAGYAICYDPLDDNLRGVGFDACLIDEQIESTAAWELMKANDYFHPTQFENRWKAKLQETVDKPKKVSKLPKQKQTIPFWSNNWRK